MVLLQVEGGKNPIKDYSLELIEAEFEGKEEIKSEMNKIYIF